MDKKYYKKTAICPHCGKTFNIAESKDVSYEMAWNLEGNSTVYYSATCTKCGHKNQIKEENLPAKYLRAFKESQKVCENVDISNEEIKDTKVKTFNNKIVKISRSELSI